MSIISLGFLHLGELQNTVASQSDFICRPVSLHTKAGGVDRRRGQWIRAKRHQTSKRGTRIPSHPNHMWRRPYMHRCIQTLITSTIFNLLDHQHSIISPATTCTTHKQAHPTSQSSNSTKKYPTFPSSLPRLFNHKTRTAYLSSPHFRTLHQPSPLITLYSCHTFSPSGLRTSEFVHTH